jgi:hypothetical protein
MNTLTPQQKLDILRCLNLSSMEVGQRTMCTCCGVQNMSTIIDIESADRIYITVVDGGAIPIPVLTHSLLVPDEELNLLIQWEDK